MLTFLWQAGSHYIFAKSWQTACYPSCGRREAMLFLQKITFLMLSSLWQAGSHDIFVKLTAHMLPFLREREAIIFLQKLAGHMLPMM
jgi:hypothetical protein